MSCALRIIFNRRVIRKWNILGPEVNWFHHNSSVFWARLVTIQLTYFVVKVVQMPQTVNRKQWFGLNGAAAVPEFHVIHGPNMLDAHNNIALFAFHTFLVEVYQNEAKWVRPNYITAAHAFVIVTLRLGLRAPLGRPQL